MSLLVAVLTVTCLGLPWTVPAPAFEPALDLATIPEPAEPAVVLPGIADVIARCESGGNPTAKNPVSSASGLYQAIDSTWTWITGLPAPANAYPVDVQHQFFLDLWDDGAGWRHWEPSIECWGHAW